MSAASPPRRTERRRLGRRLVALAALLLAFLLGVAFARTLDERPEQDRTVTTVRSVTVAPEGETSTATVTVTVP